MKALTEITLINGEKLRVAERYEQIQHLATQIPRSAPGSQFAVTRVDGHGKAKRVALLGGMFRFEEL